MKVLLIDDCDITSELMRLYLEEAIDGVGVTEYDVAKLGRPGSDFDWSAHDVLLLDYNLGKGQTGVEWLEAFGSSPGFPATVLITAVGDPYVVATAVRAGADGYLNKADLSPQSIARVTKEAVQARIRSAAPPPTRAGEPTDVARHFAREAAEGGAPGGASYRFGSLIGTGGMAKVYLAERIEDGATVVLKVMNRSFADDAGQVQRFMLEGELSSAIHSPHVVKIFEHGLTNSYAYIAMEFFGRGDLKPRIERGIDADTATLYLQHITQGLDAIHRAGIVHRDLKPANVMFRGDDSVALVDFGVSKRIGAGLDLTRSGEVIGSPLYLSPEQARGEEVDARTDLYSAGVLFYEMLTGELPYQGESLSAILFQHLHADIPQLSGALERFDPVLTRLMAKAAGDRYENAADLLQALSGLALAA